MTAIDDLLSIKLSNGIKITPLTNTSTVINPIVLPVVEQSLSDIDMMLPPLVSSVSLSDLVNIYHYWGNDKFATSITAKGNLLVMFTDKDGNAVSRSDVLDICKAPYKILLNSGISRLAIQYGMLNSRVFTSDSVTYYINPKAQPKVCYLKVGNTALDTGSYAGVTNIWNPNKGLLVQSTDPSSYGFNFPTTGADGLYFDLDIGGVNGSQLVWAPVSHGGITAIMTPSPDNEGMTRVTLAGPRASSTQIKTLNPKFT
ncbi:hypothetical protein [Gilliamella sp. ESL0254]|uniref:hypothetical protein n=1 Tax=Gilliamella sp. ESL0254 TaxID=2705035 RepID=UPI001580C92E|nr:hypothetical protein [Gilliamella sp. ESL0254]NUF26551.1 hypothetical protein [Gilliamella sp. ESL0254]